MPTLESTLAQNLRLRTLLELTIAALAEDGQKGYARLLFAQYAAIVDDPLTDTLRQQLAGGDR